MMSAFTPPLHRRLTKGRVLAAVGLAVLMLATVLSGTAAAQTDPCQSEQNRLDEFEEMLNTTSTDPGELFFNDLVRMFIATDPARDLKACKQRVAETEHDRLRGERATAGKAYANAQPYSQERADARAKWNEANDAISNHESENPSVERNQPYNDGLSDVERYYCVHKRNGDADSVQIGGSQRININYITCWN